jgi:nucleoside-diphosphate kinase
MMMAMLLPGSGVVATGRKMLGETNPANSAPGTIRGDFCVDIGR